MISSPSSQVQASLDERVLTLSLNRPERKNALTLEMYSALAGLIAAADKDVGVRVLVLTGTREFFTAGNDLMDFMNDPEITPSHPVVRFIDALRFCAKPVVAVVRGHAVGIGTTLLLHCDLAYVAADARLQLPFVNLGLCPEYASSYLVPRVVGQQKAAELFLLGEAFSGAEAAAMGLVTRALPGEELDTYAQARIARLAQQPPAAVRRTKALLREATQPAVEASLQAEYRGFAEGLGSEECKESVMAFFEKRAPDFSRFS
ncbi:enoyl-CoA hydratase [Cellvibrio japonicus]|uniref:Enoyl-CoA hydratase/isomerase family protein n=1 Tax=Cellvibrio japonicus (strain Ueda107) TaxID=498211 RepID=B3PKE2_CELJU|nr:enoyl-CoA hydratase [Cellvibrio japonicus]ACE84543.1 enoyl-CoA hydratase/isomerase family protein [Cellvibrio japonicus Ueda107]QEI12811.1 enoyl-CoA hydratase [Cellvibrio japonicus]QEI16385.1 enoyl-CoA hydratase [Cellvibrio japonicus]QEI19963.1 enoyl-CoA hydratase [Cellvibrio japonicus]